ncbi:MAG: hypothetical protein K8L91_20880 [Anaerolineae bacterium]|nr:hypothetical protein [Anaerolineae bacterium]
MRRVLRWTAVLFGIGLIGMAVLLETIRHSHEADPVMLVTDKVNHKPNTEALYLMVAGSEIHHRISPPYYDFRVLQWWRNQQWVYLLANRNSEDLNSESGIIWRIQRDNLRADPITYAVGVIGSVATPDGKWLLYLSQNQTGRNLFRVGTESGSQPYNLTLDVGDAELSLMQPEISENGRWVYFSVQQKDSVDVYRVSINGGTPQNLTATIEGSASWVGEGPDWLLFKSDDMVYITDLDGSHPRTLSADWKPNEEVELAWWWAQQNLVIVRTHSQDKYELWAYEMPSAALGWSYEGLSPLAHPSSFGSLMTIDGYGSLVYLGSDGRQAPQVIQFAGGQMGFNHDTITYLRNILASDHSATDFFELWQLLPDGTTRKIYQPVTREAVFEGVSLDGRWVAIYDYEVNSNQPHNIILNTEDGKIYRREEWVNVISWLPPIDRAWSPAGLLIIGGGALVGSIRAGGRRKV